LSHPGSYSATAAYAHLLAQSQQQAHQLAHVRSLQGAPPRLVAGHPGPLPHHFSQEASFLQYMAQPRGLPLPAANGGSSSSSSGAAYPGQPYGMPMHYQPQHPPFGYPSGAQFLRGHLYGLHPPVGTDCLPGSYAHNRPLLMDNLTLEEIILAVWCVPPNNLSIDHLSCNLFCFARPVGRRVVHVRGPRSSATAFSLARGATA